MRCLHCGTTLSAFKKFTDGDFCSAEHRDAFYSEQQTLILARLKQSAERYQRLRRPQVAADTALRAVPSAALPAQAQAPAPLAAFLLAALEQANHPVRLLAAPPIACELSPASVPEFGFVLPKGGRRFSGLIPDLPWPRYNPGLLWLSTLLIDEAHLVGPLPSLEGMGVLRSLGFPRASLLLPRRPDIANAAAPAPRTSLRASARMMRPKAQLSLGPVRLSATPSLLFGIGNFGLQAVTPVHPSAPPDHRLFFSAEPIQTAAGLQVPASLRLDRHFQSKGISFLDRLYRMRPRFGVTSEDVPVMRSAVLEPIATLGMAAPPVRAGSHGLSFEPAEVNGFVRSPKTPPVGSATALKFDSAAVALPSAPSAPAASYVRHASAPAPGSEVLPARLQPWTLSPAIGAWTLTASASVEPGSLICRPDPAFPGSGISPSAEPARLERLFRPRPRPVMAETAGFVGDRVTPESGSAQPPCFPSTALEFGPAPDVVDRFFRPRPRGPVDAEVPAAANTERTQAEAAALVPSNPASGLFPSAICEPPAAGRFFRPHPRGPVTSDNVAGPEPHAAHPQDWSAKAAVTSLPSPAVAFNLPAVTTLLRTRPRSAVLDGKASSDLTTASRPEALLSAPVTPPLAGATDAAPALVTRLFRMRPRAGVDAPTAPIHVPNLETCGYSLPRLANPASVAPPLSAEIHFLDRLYRGRPRNPIAGAATSFTQAHPGNQEPVASSSPLPPSLLVETAALAPDLSYRFLGGRPRTGVLDAALAASLASSAAAEPLLSAPQRPALSLLSCEPTLVDRLFRMRPRSGVGQLLGLAPQWIAAGPVDIATKPAVAGFKPAGSGSLAPRLLDRLYRGRPRMGVPSPELPSFCPIDATHSHFESRPATVCQTIPDCAPPASAKLFRFRPKTGSDARTPATLSLAAPVAFPASVPEFMPDWWDVMHGAKPMFVNKMYRMRLKQPAQDAGTVTHAIRVKHLPAQEAEPVLATLPPPAPLAAPSFLDRLYRMRPKSGKSSLPAASAIPCEAIEAKVFSGAPASALQSVSKQWRATPLRIKSLAATVPVLLLLALFPWGTPTIAAENPLREAISQRAAVQRTADFVAHLSQWPGSDRWKLLPSGAIEPRGLALFKPSLDMRNYRLSFQTQVQKGAVGFLVRATDERNYQAVQLKVVKPGPLPVVKVVRWTVIGGVQGNRHELRLPINVTADTQYRISLEVNDRSFTLMVQDQLVDFWSEEQLKSGGAGFFGGKGDQATIHSVHMTHQDDAIGRLFAALTLPERSSE